MPGEALYLDVQSWIDQDPDSETRTELEQLLEQAVSGDAVAEAELHDRFDTRLSFGTAGLRGALAGGPNRMNRVVVAQAAAGIAHYLLSNSENPSIVIGYDGRKNSHIFAQDSAEILAGLGITVHLMPRMTPTPILAFAVRELGTSAGIMVTASHNPPADNGYKVYLGDTDAGSQIVPPVDAAISAAIEQIATSLHVTQLPRGEYEVVGEDVLDAYVARTASLVAEPIHQPRVIYTAMHGVGWDLFSQVLRTAGFDEPTVVAEQNLPDATFPTLAFPNPEESGALDRAYALARESDAELILAHDPDADRLGVAIPDEASASGFRRLTGNELGSIFGWWAARRAAQEQRTGTLACSVVSSPALEAVAKAYDLDFSWTLTGFKWISRVPKLIFGYEEALGYLVNPETVRDKDGISAALVMLSIVSELAAAGKTLADHLDEFTEEFGFFASDQVSLRKTSIAAVDTLMAELRHSTPKAIGSLAIERRDDLLDGVDGFPPANIVRYWLADGSRIMVRPSGTEPKLKIYLDVIGDGGTPAQRRGDTQAKLVEFASAMKALLGE